jgi:hypothetical protein
MEGVQHAKGANEEDGNGDDEDDNGIDDTQIWHKVK